MILKYANDNKSVVGTDNKGKNVSYLIDAKEVKEFLANGGVVEPEFTQAELDAQATTTANNALKAELDELDKQSIREIREWTASQPDAPQALKDRESQAVSVRAKLK